MVCCVNFISSYFLVYFSLYTMLLNIIMCVLLAFYICHTLFTYFDICDTELLQLIVLVVVLIL
jgi:hypothetical protein